MWDVILLFAIIVFIGWYLWKRSGDREYDIEVFDDDDYDDWKSKYTEDDRSDPPEFDVDITGGDKKPWTEVDRFSRGKIVNFTDEMESGKECPWCQNPLMLPDPYESDHRGWVCSSCNVPHHLTCRKKAKQCCSNFCFKI